jgi:hypothetical protein
LPQLVSRLPFPSAWRVLLIFDAHAGLRVRTKRLRSISCRTFRKAKLRS